MHCILTQYSLTLKSCAILFNAAGKEKKYWEKWGSVMLCGAERNCEGNVRVGAEEIGDDHKRGCGINKAGKSNITHYLCCSEHHSQLIIYELNRNKHQLLKTQFLSFINRVSGKFKLSLACV